ncbi:DNA excision repair protein ERCC-1 [Toxorhynchites rutilus septentrionalis]|uniref:DNA excision repair protein ERCC-1 n=1 Tax=Toxorhynchites rutilus septentrionalis TaxID=329112 RepID=UPI0024794E8E|nr:DNA excision repair protein ERCC-1 [Toxorhynchites rutilus septentrionalis]
MALLNDTQDDDDLLANLDLPSPPKKAAISAAEPLAGTSSTSDTNKVVVKPKVNKGNCVLVNPKQRGNPLLKSIQNIPWEYDDIVPDYVVGATSCILFISLRYHNLNPDYIHGRLKQLGKMYQLRVLLVQVDLQEPHNALKHLTRICLLADLTLMLAWNADEAGKIVETYKMFENKPPDLIMERAQQHPYQKLVSALTHIKPVNKTDAMTLIQNYGTLANIINSSEEKLSQCTGLGPRKAKKLYKTFNENFLKS